MQRPTSATTLALFCSLAAAPAALAAEYHVYLLAGQSNMEGFGTTADLGPDMLAPVHGTLIYCGQTRQDAQQADGLGVWSQLTPGFGTGFRTDGHTNFVSDRFGPELTFARRLRELQPDQRIAIIKYTKGGSSLDARAGETWGTWDPHDTRTINGLTGINQYDHMLAVLRRAHADHDIDNDGQPDTLIPAGIIWMQGETDATQADTANAYADNLTEIIALFRAAMRDDDLPVVIGRISDRGVNEDTDERVWAFGDTVRAAQQSLADADPNAALVTSTDAYGYSDPFHYDSAGYLDLGRRFAETLDALLVPDDE